MSNAAVSTGKIARWFRRAPWEAGAMALIAAGIVMLVQPWSIDLYGYSFVTILAGTLARLRPRLTPRPGLLSCAAGVTHVHCVVRISDRRPQLLRTSP